MASDDFEYSYLASDRLEARELLMSINANAYPHSKREWQKNYHRSVYRLAYPQTFEQTQEQTMEALATLLSSGGRG